MIARTEILLLPAPASAVAGLLPPPRPAALMLPAPRVAGLLPAPRVEQTPEQPQIEIFWDMPQRTRLSADVQAALDPNTAQLLKQVQVYLVADKANPDLLNAAIADFTAAVQRIGREQCGHKRPERPQAACQAKTKRRPAPTGGRARSKEEMDAEIADIAARHMENMRAKFGGANGANAFH